MAPRKNRKRAQSEPRPEPESEDAAVAAPPAKKRGRPSTRGRSVSATTRRGGRSSGPATPAQSRARPQPRTASGAKPRVVRRAHRRAEEDGSFFVPMEPESSFEIDDPTPENDELADDPDSGVLDDALANVESDADDAAPQHSPVLAPVSLRVRIPLSKLSSPLLSSPAPAPASKGIVKREQRTKSPIPLVITSDSESDHGKKIGTRAQQKRRKSGSGQKPTKNEDSDASAEEENLESDDDKDIIVDELKVAIEEDGATEHLTFSFDASYDLFRYHVANHLGKVPDNLRLAYRTPNMPKTERHHLRNQVHFCEMITAARGWIESKQGEIRDGQKGRRGKQKELARVQKARTALRGAAVTIVDLNATGKRSAGKQAAAAKPEPAESSSTKQIRYEREIRQRSCPTCGKNCAIIYIPGGPPEHRELPEELIQLWASLAVKGQASLLGHQPPPQVIARMTDVKFARQHKREKNKSDAQATPAAIPAAHSHPTLPQHPHLVYQPPYHPAPPQPMPWNFYGPPMYGAPPGMPAYYPMPPQPQPFYGNMGVGPWGYVGAGNPVGYPNAAAGDTFAANNTRDPSSP